MADLGDPRDAYEELSWERAAPLLPVDCLLMTATRVELRALRPKLQPLEGRDRVLRIPWHESTYYVGRIGRYCCGLTMSDPGSAGRGGAGLTLYDAARRLDPSFTIAVGIAFGNDPRKQKIGNVLASTTVLPYENQRVQPGGSIPRSPQPEAGGTLLNRLKLLDSEDVLDGAIQFGPLLSGEKLVDDPEFKKQLFAQFPAAIGGEMEAAGIYAAAERSKIEWLVVKAICDWGDGKKTKKYQEMAAAKATAAVVALLGRGGLERSVFRRNSPPAPDVHDLGRSLMLETAVSRVRHADRARQETSEALAAEVRSLIGADGTPRFSRDPTVAALARAKIDDVKRKQAVALEAWLNTYNDAASQYLGGKIDAVDFERALGLEITEIVELDGPHRERLDPRESSAYAALWSASDRLKAKGVARALGGQPPEAAVVPPASTVATRATPAVVGAPDPNVTSDRLRCVAVDDPPEPADSGAHAPILAGLVEPRVALPSRAVHVWPFSVPESLIRKRDLEAFGRKALPDSAVLDDLLLPRGLNSATFENRGLVWREQGATPAVDRTLAIGTDASVASIGTLWEAHYSGFADLIGLGSCVDSLCGAMDFTRRLLAQTGRAPRLWVTLSLHDVQGRRFVLDGDPTAVESLFPGTRSQPLSVGVVRAGGQFDVSAPSSDWVPMLVEIADNLVYATGWRPSTAYLEQRARRVTGIVSGFRSRR